MSGNFFRILLQSLLLITIFISCKTGQPMHSEKNTVPYALRLRPGQDLRKEIENFVKENKIQAGWIATCAGSLTHYNIRFANRSEGNDGSGHFEIVSLTGTVSVNGSHMHISISDSTGHTIGGHLLEGCIVYTTAEIIIESSPDLIFKREKDGTTEWEELQIEKIKKQ